MNFRAPQFAVALVLLGSMLRPCVAEKPATEEPAAELRPGEAGVLLLRNGEMLEGKITPAGDRYDVVLPAGVLHVKASEVEFVGADVEACFRRRREGIDADKIHDHLTLADWCLRHSLYENASAQLAAAKQLDPAHPKIGLLERRLQMALEPATATSRSVPVASDQPTTDDLDRMVRGMPPGSVEAFTNSVQPVLLNRCSNANCHGPNSTTDFKLLRTPTGRTTSRRTTQRNLHAALSAIDRLHPDESKLLIVPLKAHGGSKAPIFTSRQAAQFRPLIEWVFLTANAKPVDKESTPASLPAAVAKAIPLPKATSIDDTAAYDTTAVDADHSEADHGSSEAAKAAHLATEKSPAGTARPFGTADSGAVGTHIEQAAHNAPANTLPPRGKTFRSPRKPVQVGVRPADVERATQQPAAPQGQDPFDPALFNERPEATQSAALTTGRRAKTAPQRVPARRHDCSKAIQRATPSRRA